MTWCNRGKVSKEESDISYLNRNIWYTVQYDDDNTSTIHDRDSVWTYIENAPVVEVTAASVPSTFIPLPCITPSGTPPTALSPQMPTSIHDSVPPKKIEIPFR